MLCVHYKKRSFLLMIQLFLPSRLSPYSHKKTQKHKSKQHNTNIMPTNKQRVQPKSRRWAKRQRQAPSTSAAQNASPTMWHDYYNVTTHGEATQDGAHHVSCKAQCRYCWMFWTSRTSSPSAISLQLHLHFCPGRRKRAADQKKKCKLGKCPPSCDLAAKDETSTKGAEEWHYDGEQCQPPQFSKLTTDQMRERFVIGTKGFRLKAQCRDCDRRVCNKRYTLCSHLAGCAMRRKFLLFRGEKAGRWVKCRDCGEVVKADRGVKMMHLVKECPARSSD
ncbi:uncharacterized protein BO95DRAFT_236542 [Aspergillus brunneoviolaceus CBS 621.78]|uniref:Uncharacterized protein n=1 Tax=Aspergillus brunneoviolaceus CBS 621.78 TaxID=1450534 RepID=A0ACD1FZQ1_9EURO|nr:hypothetical protein BO95DRAFT_236542 [Aspergillus brunneoviolaceus CBS 621.78]RAH42465.1 hypothetical protein BO95DRAFT_236542 [Aspergillus brunneoviolaceus CBS 621.78]